MPAFKIRKVGSAINGASLTLSLSSDSGTGKQKLMSYIADIVVLDKLVYRENDSRAPHSVHSAFCLPVRPADVLDHMVLHDASRDMAILIFKF